MVTTRIPWRRRPYTLMLAVALCAAGLGAGGGPDERGPVDRLIGQLRAVDARARGVAARRIGLLGPRAEPALEAMDAALDDPDPAVRAEAMYALARLGSRSTRLLPILAEQIENTPEPRRWAWKRPATWGPDPPKGWTLSDGGLIYDDPLDALKWIRPDAKAFVPLLAKALKSPDPEAREAQLAQIARRRIPGVHVEAPDDWVHKAALEALFAVATGSGPSSPELAEALLGVLADQRYNPEAFFQEALDEFLDRVQVVNTLAKLDLAAQEKAVAQLAGDLRGLGTRRSCEAAVLLPRLAGGKSAAASILLDFIRDGDDIHRRAAMILLEPIAEPAQAPAVMKAITAPGADREVDLRGHTGWWKAVRTKERVGRGYSSGNDPADTGRLDTTLVGNGVRALKAMGESVERRSIRDLAAILREPGGDPARKRSAIIALGDFGAPAAEAVPVLEGVIREGQEADRRASRRFADWKGPGALATAALGRIGADGSSEAIAVLAGLIETPDWTVGILAARELFGMGPRARAARPALIKALKDPRPSVRSDAAGALARIGAL